MLSIISYPLILVSYFSLANLLIRIQLCRDCQPSCPIRWFIHIFFLLGWQSQEANGKFLKDIFWHLALDGLLRQLGSTCWKNFWAILITKWLLGLLNVFSPSALWKWNDLHVVYCQRAQRCRLLYSWELQMFRVNWICCTSTRHVESWVTVVIAACFTSVCENLKHKRCIK